MQIQENYTKHAAKRAKGRSIPEAACWLLREFGSRKSVGRGCWSYSFDKNGWKKVEAFFGSWQLKKMEQLKKVYMIEAECGQIITLAYRYA